MRAESEEKEVKITAYYDMTDGKRLYYKSFIEYTVFSDGTVKFVPLSQGRDTAGKSCEIRPYSGAPEGIFKREIPRQRAI